MEEKMKRDKEMRDERAAQRKNERADKYNEIRIKYGLQSGKQYAKMDDS